MAEITSTMKVLIGIDKSDYAEYAYTYYMKYIHRPEYEVVLLHVLEIPATSIMYMSGAVWEEQVQREKDKANSLEKDFSDRLLKSQINGRMTSSLSNKPGEAICKVAEEESANMIVLGSRGSGKMRRTIMGSVSDYVLHHAHCPVVVCRQEVKAHHHQSIFQRLRRASSGDKQRRHSESERERKDSESGGRERNTSESGEKERSGGLSFGRKKRNSESRTSESEKSRNNSTDSNGK